MNHADAKGDASFSMKMEKRASRRREKGGGNFVKREEFRHDITESLTLFTKRRQGFLRQGSTCRFTRSTGPISRLRRGLLHGGTERVTR